MGVLKSDPNIEVLAQSSRATSRKRTKSQLPKSLKDSWSRNQPKVDSNLHGILVRDGESLQHHTSILANIGKNTQEAAAEYYSTTKPSAKA